MSEDDDQPLVRLTPVSEGLPPDEFYSWGAIRFEYLSRKQIEERFGTTTEYQRLNFGPELP